MIWLLYFQSHAQMIQYTSTRNSQSTFKVDSLLISVTLIYVLFSQASSQQLR